MARSSLTSIEQDLIDDGGSVLWSFIKGEQLEYPITLNFVTNALTGYTYEAVVVEADNVAGQTSRPTTHKTGGVQTVLVVRTPTLLGTWSAATTYALENIVLYNGIYYRSLSAGNLNNTPSAVSIYWAQTTINTIYVQFPSTLGSTYAVSAQVGSPIYGFFELRVTEPAGTIYQKTWKPIRGMVEILFSPTDIVP